eukprot:scaffold36006_cov47-Phaeocystis_antarctica.AAC.2
MRSASRRSSSSTRVSIWITIVLARCILMYGVLERKISTNEPGPSATTESGFHSSGTIWSAARSCGTSPNAGKLPICVVSDDSSSAAVVSDDSSSAAVSWTPRLWANAAALRGHPPSSAQVERLASSTLTIKRRANAASMHTAGNTRLRVLSVLPTGLEGAPQERSEARETIVSTVLSLS